MYLERTYLLLLMDLQFLITRFLRYNLWANERLVSWLKTLDRPLLTIATKSSFGTIERTLKHILIAQTYWHTLLVKGEIKEFDIATAEDVVDQIMADLISSSHQLIDDLTALNEDKLLEKVQASDSTQSRYDYILHVVNHSSYHRGQVITMCRALGFTGEIPVTDFDAYLWWIENT